MTSTLPLKGTRVLDFSRVIAGPYTTRMLADLGAEVLKVEPPEGDQLREAQAGFFVDGVNSFFHHLNVGKQSICVDLNAEGATQLVLELAAEADIVVENFRPGIMKKFGIDWSALQAVNPRLVMLSISGFGQNGPESDRAAYAPIIHAELGLLDRQAYFNGSSPHDFHMSVADICVGLHGMVAVLTALMHARVTGEGQYIDLPMVSAMAFSDDWAQTMLEGRDVHLTGNNQIFETQDGSVVIGGDEKWLWHILSITHGLSDDGFVGELKDKIANRRRLMQDWVRSFPDRAALVAALDKANLAWGDVTDYRKAWSTQHSLRALGAFTEVQYPSGPRPVTRSPYNFSSLRTEIRGPSPELGADSSDVLRAWLAADEEHVSALRERGVLARPRSRSSRA